MSGGGGDSGAATAMAMMQMSSDQLRESREANQFAAGQATQQHQWSLDATAAAAAKDAADKQHAITQFQNDLATAVSGANTYAGRKEGAMGVSGGNDYGLMDNFRDLLQSTLSGIGSEQTGNAGALVNGQALFDQANSDTLSAERNKLQQGYNKLFGPNFVQDQLGNNLLSADMGSALTDQQATAQSAIDRALARGTLNQTGYDYANQQLSKQSAAANAKIKAAGQGVLDGYRQQLTDALSGAKNTLTNWTYGDNTDLSSIQGQINNYLSQDKANASGDFQNAIAGQSYFDPTSILSSAGTYQGTAGGSGTTGTTGTGANSGFLANNNANPLATKPVSNGVLQNQGVV